MKLQELLVGKFLIQFLPKEIFTESAFVVSFDDVARVSMVSVSLSNSGS